MFCINRADIVDYGNAFNLTRYLANETEYIVWDRVATSISYVRDMLADDQALYRKFQVGPKVFTAFQSMTTVLMKKTCKMLFQAEDL